jgi:hypothetical protein
VERTPSLQSAGLSHRELAALPAGFAGSVGKYLHKIIVGLIRDNDFHRQA